MSTTKAFFSTGIEKAEEGRYVPGWRPLLPCHPIRPPGRAPLSVAWLHVCGVCVSVPGQGRCQRWACHSPRREIGGLGTKAHRTLASSPRTPLGSECGARNWSPAQPQYCHLCTHPCKSPEDCPPQKLPSRENLCQLWSGEVGPGPSTSAPPSLTLSR